ncbi:MAG: hypothetical protein H6684_08975 [Deltaproteobacteria bacterium]|nr:hypothetical protein [Deltaproteobacteria bacterium]MCB9479613.1 hypothetical protein [Deltaproteobacteria bacterium]MCB9488849.1 hypothetical protein [Deltaproteobacteria bacterium]
MQMKRWGGLALVLGLLLVAAPATAQQVIPDLWPVDEDDVESDPALGDLDILDELRAANVIDEATYETARRKVARKRLSALHPTGTVLVAYTPENETEYDDFTTYPGSPDEERGFWLNKADLGLEGSVIFPWLSTKLILDSKSNDDGSIGVRVDQASIKAAVTPNSMKDDPVVPKWGLLVGAQKIPFSRQSNKSTGQLQFISRSVVVSEMPIRYDIGATLLQKYKLQDAANGKEWANFTIDAGIYNGRGDHVYVNDNNDDSMVALRASVDLFGTMAPGEGDLMPRYWPHKLAANDPESLWPKLSLGFSYLNNKDIDRDVTAIGYDAEFRWSGLSVQYERIHTLYEPDLGEVTVADTLADDWETDGWYVQGGLFIIPRHLELAARYEEYMLDLQTDLDDKRVVSATTYGVNLHLATKHRLKLMANWVERGELEGMPEIDNDTFTVQGALSF